MTTVAGSYAACGDDFTYKFTCEGPQCHILKNFPFVTCNEESGKLTCARMGSSCGDAASNYSSTFTYQQPKVRVTSSQEIILPDQCEKIHITTDGTQNGTKVTSEDLPGSNCPINCCSCSSASSRSSSSRYMTSTRSTEHSTCSKYITHTEISKRSMESASAVWYTNNTNTFSSSPSQTTVISTDLGETSTYRVSTTYNISTPGSYPSIMTVSRSSRSTTVPIWCTILLIFGLLMPGILALDAEVDVQAKFLNIRSSTDIAAVRARALLERGLMGDLMGIGSTLVDYYQHEITGSDLMDMVIKQVESAVCKFAEEKMLTKGASWLLERATGVAVIEECTAAADTIVIAVAPEILAMPGGAIALNMGAGLVCNYMLQKMFSIPDAVEAICKQDKPCTNDFLNDPNNCKFCGNKCASGVCHNGACTSNSCTGETCESFTTCGPGSSCVCASSTEGTGYCVDGSTSCPGLADCSTSFDCAAGEICAVSTCCVRKVCVGATSCGGSLTSRSIPRFLTGTYGNATVADKGIWSD